MEERERVYLDTNATTPLETEVLESIYTALQDAWGNPSSQYEQGVRAKNLITEARIYVARMIGANERDIIFTSGGTESNNLVFHTAVKYFWNTWSKVDTDLNGGAVSPRNLKPHIITSNLEHDSVKLVLEQFVQDNIADVTVVHASTSSGRVEVEDIVAAVRPTTCMVSVMMANNETGIIQRGLCILLHTDAAQAIGKIAVDAADLGVDYLTIVGHKFYGPRIGALYVNNPGEKTPLYSMFYGGGQERNFRPGTENTGMIAGLGKASELVSKNLVQYEKQMRQMRDYLEEQLLETFGTKVHFNGKFKSSHRIPNTCNVSILGKGLDGHRILSTVQYLQASVGAACHSQNRPSPILLAIGIKEDIARNALRLSVGRHTRKQDIDLVVQDLKNAVDTLEKDKK